MNAIMKSLLFLALGAEAFAAAGIEGDWQGTLKAGAAELRLVLHITKAADGALAATLDSVDQNAYGIPVTSVTLKDSKLALRVDAVHGAYEGTVNADATGIRGTWSQGQPLPLDFKRARAKAASKPAAPSDIDGDWLGTLYAGGMKLRVVFHIANTGDGLTATMDSPDQGAKGLPATAVTRNGAALKIELKQIGGVFEGAIAKDLASIEGTWSQPGGKLPLTLKRVKDASGLERRRRPQEPAKPYPYREEEVAYENKAAGVKLAATLTIPPGPGPFPAVLLITGSGPQDRDESLMGHKPFLVLADALTRKNICVLRADDRGTGSSTGDFGAATTVDFAADAEAGLAFLKQRPEADPSRLGLIGHSEGGIIAPMIAARNPDVAFIVLMAAPGVPGDEILISQTRALAGEANVPLEREILTLVKQEKDNAALERKLRDKLGGKLPEAQLAAQMRMIASPWFRHFLEYDPAAALAKVTCPVLAITGEKDVQVDPKLNLPVIRKSLEAAGNKRFEAEELPGLNHLFQTAKTGAPTEYGEIEETMAPAALDKIATWILAQSSAVSR